LNVTKASTIKKKVSRKVKITKDMLIGDILEKYPQSVDIFAKYGFHCIGCMISPYESLEDGAAVHNIPRNRSVFYLFGISILEFIFLME